MIRKHTAVTIEGDLINGIIKHGKTKYTRPIYHFYTQSLSKENFSSEIDFSIANSKLVFKENLRLTLYELDALIQDLNGIKDQIMALHVADTLAPENEGE